MTLGRLAPRHYAVRRRPRCPRLARRAVTPYGRGTRLAERQQHVEWLRQLTDDAIAARAKEMEFHGIEEELSITAAS